VLIWAQKEEVPQGEETSVWDPATGKLTSIRAPFGDLHCAGQATLADGRVIVLGGTDAGGKSHGLAVNALFDPFTSTWTAGPPMAYARWYPTVTTLPDGRVLATGGVHTINGVREHITTPEIYDPATNRWMQLKGASQQQGLYPRMFVLPTGKVYQADTEAQTWLLDPSGQGAWTEGPAGGSDSKLPQESLVMYTPGKILRAGGGDPGVARTTIVDMTAARPQWQESSPMAFPRRHQNLVLLADGSVMAVGGTREGDLESQAVLAGEIWSPTTQQWTTVASMSEPRMYHSAAVLLPDGRVLTGGGELAASELHAQIYAPPYLFKGPRPTISAAPATAGYGGRFAVSTPQAASIASVALIRPGAATHGFDHNQRYVPLTFTRAAGTLTVTAPANSNIAPPGYYMLVIKDTQGVPSVAKWVQLR
jgi:hypothetical protein